MQDFNDIQNLWKNTETSVKNPLIDYSAIKSNRQKIRANFFNGSVLLFVTALFIFGLMFFLDSKMQTPTILLAMSLVIVLCLLQALLMYTNVRKIDQISETQTPEKHLQQWQNFNDYRKKQTHWNLPVYYLLLSSALAVYMYELLKDADKMLLVTVFSATFGWMLFSYFYLGKRSLKKMDAKFDGIIGELKNLENQFNS